MKKLIPIFILLFLCSCADSVDISKCAAVDPDGFWMGLWHGFTCAISFIGSLFSDDIAIYSVNNTGGWYDFGFVLGAGILIGGGSSEKII